jgi:hypothetical protein
MKAFEAKFMLNDQNDQYGVCIHDCPFFKTLKKVLLGSKRQVFLIFSDKSTEKTHKRRHRVTSG